ARDLLLYGNLAHNDGKYTGPFPCTNQFGQLGDCQDKELVGLIPWKGTLGFRYTPPLPVPGTVRLNGSWAYHDEYQNNVANTPLVYTVEASTYNASVSWQSPDEKWDVGLDVRNLFDKHYSLAGLQLSHPVRPAVSAFPNPPREIVLRIGMSF